MFNQYAIIFDQRVPMYTVALVIALIMSFIWMVMTSPQDWRGRVMDVCLSALFGGLFVGRIGHVALNWVFFSENVDLIWQLQREGGINWQGALWGALLFGGVMARVRQIPLAHLLDRALVILPLLSLAGWYGCATAGCAYGQAVERLSAYPDWMVWIAPDIYSLEMPRFATQMIAMRLSAGLLLITIVLYAGRWLKQIRFWLIIMSLASLSFVLDFLRGDYAVSWNGLHIHQWLDSVTLIGAVICLLWVILKREDPAESPQGL